MVDIVQRAGTRHAGPRGLAASPTIGEADAALDAARASRDIVYGGTAPELGANVSAERTRINAAAFGFDGFPTRTISRYSLGLA
ncbi:MAG: hypothetical protein IPG56_19130 [Caulobacteraceae bacterium]|nr:hypothetical protein [Caulobacteraceae bacterium]